MRRRSPAPRTLAEDLVPAMVTVAAAAGCNGGAERQRQVEASLHRTLAAQARPPYVTSDAEGRKLCAAKPGFTDITST